MENDFLLWRKLFIVSRKNRIFDFYKSLPCEDARNDFLKIQMWLSE